MSAVIKAGHTGPLLKHLSTVDLADHLAKADEVVARAGRKATQLVSNAREQVQEAYRQSNEEGYEAGYRKGEKEGAEAGYDEALRGAKKQFDDRHGDLVTAMRSALIEFEKLKERIDLQAQRNVLEFAVDVASRLTFRIGSEHRESAQENLRRALEIVGRKTDLTVSVHPADVESMRSFAKTLVEDLEASSAVRVREDDSIAPGGCRVRTDQTEVDATLETQVEQLVDRLIGRDHQDG